MFEETRSTPPPAPLPTSGAELAAMMKIGTRVVRGQDWKWGDQVSGSFSRVRTESVIAKASLFPVIFLTNSVYIERRCRFLRKRDKNE